ncbi:MAG TPA: radical SAM family heme chaperone HemW [Gaiellaceae bacterium]|nr:radical SAM family heme chaperone HemW [Gaiellaceae bacterium]
MSSDGVRHLYVHLPYCASRCGYCDFVTLVGHRGEHERYADALLAELELERDLLAQRVETVFLGGGTPTFTDGPALERLLADVPAADEVTVEANPETVTPELADALRRGGVSRVSLGAQTFEPRLLQVLERRAQPDDVRRAFYRLRDAGFDNISLDLVYGIPGQEPSDVARDLGEALALGPEHLSCYELEAKPGTRFTHAHGEELARQAESMEGYFELVVDTLTAAGYRWYETANFCRDGRRSRHNLACWLGRDYLGLGIGAVSTVVGSRWRNAPSLRGYLGALGAGERPPRELEPLPETTRIQERLMLALRLDEPVSFAEVEAAVDHDALARLQGLRLVERRGDELLLTRRGRFLGGGVTAALLAEIPANQYN